MTIKGTSAPVSPMPSRRVVPVESRLEEIQTRLASDTVSLQTTAIHSLNGELNGKNFISKTNDTYVVQIAKWQNCWLKQAKKICLLFSV